MNKYKLNTSTEESTTPTSMWTAVKRFRPLLAQEKWALLAAAIAIAVNTILTLIGPSIIGTTVDEYIQTGDYRGVLINSAILVGMYLVALVASYLQTRIMGGVGQRVLFQLRNWIFEKIQDLPVSFFQQNKAGDLISRINNDTEKLGQFFSQALMQFIGNIFVIIGAAIALVLLHTQLGLIGLLPALGLLVFTKLLGAWVRRRNSMSMKSMGSLTSNVQEQLENFKVVVAFDRRDFLRNAFKRVNDENYRVAVRAGIANNTFTPLYSFASNAALLIVIIFGFQFITAGTLTIGVLISAITYVNRLYDPLRHMANLWTQFQVAFAGWDRIYEILMLENDLDVIEAEGTTEVTDATPIVSFSDVTFQYNDSAVVLRNTTFNLEHGKTYALVGPTGGGKTTTASLMARLFDPTTGTVAFNGTDIRTMTAEERAKRIGFILQEPFLFSGTVGDNIRYGNAELEHVEDDALLAMLTERGLERVVDTFEEGLATTVVTSGDSISLGQKQLVAFMRALLRDPELLILDEATANIDTVTEQLLEEILRKLPSHTTRVVIAHRLNTIADADTIFFVNNGTIIEAGSMEQAIELLENNKRTS